MSYEVIQKVGEYQYIYLAEGYRNEDGNPRQKRRSIGKINLETGAKVYKPEYLAELRQQGVILAVSNIEEMFTLEDIHKSEVLSYGLFTLFKTIANKNGLAEALLASFPQSWEEIFMLACYMISSGDPLMYCSEWLSSTISYDVGTMKSQRISELLVKITSEQRSEFYRSWYLAHQENEYLALDITSESSYSKLIEEVEWGYNRDKEKLPQINLCMLMGEVSRIPIYQEIYSGSLSDVKTLVTTLECFRTSTGAKNITIVTDKGFFSKKNINYLLGSEEREAIHFLTAVPFTSSFAKQQVESEQKDIDCIENTIMINGQSMRAVTKERTWDQSKEKLYTHIYFNAKKASSIREDLYATVAIVREKAKANPKLAMNDEECKKYLIIRTSEKQASGYTITIRNEVIERKLKTAGWVILISNQVSDAVKAMEIYRDKDVVEKGFDRLKNNIDLGRLRVHSSNAMQGKQFIGFIAGILMAEINKVMSTQNLYKKYTMKELLMLMWKQKVQYIKGQNIVFPETKEQREIYKAFGVTLPKV